MDTPSASVETGALNTNEAAQAFSALLDGPVIEEKSGKDLENEVLEDLTKPKAETPEAETEPDAESDDDETITIKVDGKDVTLTKAEAAEAYKNGLRQSDYTKKTMEVSEQRKAAEAAQSQAQQERHAYATNLQKMSAQLEGALQEQNKIDWQSLLDTDPVEYLKQQHLYQQRQAAYQQTQQQQQHVWQIEQAERAKASENFIQAQRGELLAKLPDWKDPAKAKAEQGAIAKYLIEFGYAPEVVTGYDRNGNKVSDGLTDHKAVILGRKAMLYDAMMDKANAASKKIQQVPQKVIKPGAGESPNALDKRGAAMQRLGRTGKVEDAAAVFANFI